MTFHLGTGVLVVRHLISATGRSLPSLEDAMVQFRFADWFLRWGISITTCREMGSLKITIRPIPIVPANSAIFQACALGDDQTVARLIREGKASVFNMTSQGVTPLHVRHKLISLLKSNPTCSAISIFNLSDLLV